MGSKAASEAELLQASLAGSRQAFGAIVEKYQALVCGITYSATGNKARSEDLAQEAFIRAWRELRQLRDLGRFRAWLCTIARNAARKSVVKQGRDAADGAEPIADLKQFGSAEPGPVEHAISTEQETLVWAALKAIPETYREPLVLFYRQQQSVSQVAAELDVSEDVVKQRLSRGRRLLKAELASVVEDVIEKTRPGKVFTIAVIAALPAVTAEATTAAVAAATAKAAPALKAAFFSGLAGAALGPILGLIGGILGTCLGVLGGIFGTRRSLKNARSPREKRFIIKLTVVIWLEVSVLLALLTAILILRLKGIMSAKTYLTTYLIVMAFYTPLLIVTVIRGDRRHKQIRKKEGSSAESPCRPAQMAKGNIYGAFCGSFIGATCWIFILSFVTGTWQTAVVVAVISALILFVSIKRCLRDRDIAGCQRILIADMLALCALNLVVVNAQWSRWMQIYRQSTFYNARNDIPLWAMNLIIGAVFGFLLLMFLIHKQRSTGTKRSVRSIKGA